MDTNAKLTPKQAIFIAEYLVDGNATRAAIAAGFAVSSADVTGARLLKNSKVAKALAFRHARRVDKLEITAERVLGELAKLAFFDPGKLFDESGHLLPIAEMDDVTRVAVAGLDVELREGGSSAGVGLGVSRVSKVKLADKGQNLERLGRYLKLFTDRVEHDGKLTLEQLVCGANDPDEDGESGSGAAA
jgi:phage terminase small subunit